LGRHLLTQPIPPAALGPGQHPTGDAADSTTWNASPGMSFSPLRSLSSERLSRAHQAAEDRQPGGG
jgi:hypothetical protein